MEIFPVRAQHRPSDARKFVGQQLRSQCCGGLAQADTPIPGNRVNNRANPAEWDFPKP